MIAKILIFSLGLLGWLEMLLLFISNIYWSWLNDSVTGSNFILCTLIKEDKEVENRNTDSGYSKVNILDY